MLNMYNYVSVFGLVIVISMTSSFKVKAQTYEKLYDTDIVGNDISGANQHGVSEKQCAAICRDMFGCVAYSWVRSQKWCWPKTDVSQTESKSGVVSGILSSEETEYHEPSTSAEGFVPAGECVIVAASRRTLSEVDDFISGLGKRVANVRVFQAENDWYAITVGTARSGEGKAVIRELIADGIVPNDAFCSTGINYVREVNIDKGFPNDKSERRAADKDIEPAQKLKLGRDAFSAGDYSAAFQNFMPLADQGMAEAQTYVGYMYANGKGLDQNDEEAVKWYQKAANQGDQTAKDNLQFMYDEGRGLAALSEGYVVEITCGSGSFGVFGCFKRDGFSTELKITKDDISEIWNYSKIFRNNNSSNQLIIPVPERFRIVAQNALEHYALRIRVKDHEGNTLVQKSAGYLSTIALSDQDLAFVDTYSDETTYTATFVCSREDMRWIIEACLNKTQMVVAKNGISEVYSPYSLPESWLSDNDEKLEIQLPESFSIQAENSHPDLILQLVIRDLSGTVVFQDQAGEYGTINVKN